VRSRGTVRQLQVAAVLPLEQATVVEGVEHQLALETQQVECPRPISGQERAGGSEVLAQHDLRRFRGHVRIAAVASGEALKGSVEIGQLFVDGAGLLQLVATAEVERRHTIADGRVGMIAQPGRRLHDVRICVVHDATELVVWHGNLSPGARPGYGTSNEARS